MTETRGGTRELSAEVLEPGVALSSCYSASFGRSRFTWLSAYATMFDLLCPCILEGSGRLFTGSDAFLAKLIES